MARTKDFGDDVLIDIVLQYADEHPGEKLMVSRIVRWACETIADMQDIKRHHLIYSKKAQEKIHELNEIRETAGQTKKRLMDFSVDESIESFFNSSPIEQRQIIRRVGQELKCIRIEKSELAAHNVLLQRKLDAHEKTAKPIMPSDVQAIRKQLDKLEKQFRFILSAVDEENCRKIYEEAGITDQNVDYTKLTAYMHSLEGKVFDMEQTIRKHCEQVDVPLFEKTSYSPLENPQPETTACDTEDTTVNQPHSLLEVLL